MKIKFWIVLILIIGILILVYLYIAIKNKSVSITPSMQAINTQIITTKIDAKKEKYLVGSKGMTLYTFDRDQADTSNCSDTCVTIWPIYTTIYTSSTSLPANLTIFTRTDGMRQYVYNNKPLYYYSGDKKIGDMTGDGVNGLWHIARP
jgi:predicted lipoprotein with Yx(FWY)xxD motif